MSISVAVPTRARPCACCPITAAVLVKVSDPDTSHSTTIALCRTHRRDLADRLVES